jgi:MFS superfamily sulfate permease-like transporter
VTGVVASGLVLVVLVLFTSSLTDLPRAALSAIVIHAVWGLMDLDALRRYIAVRRNDFLAAMAAMIGVLLLGPLYGLLFAIGQSLLGLVYRSSRVHVDVMGKVPGEKAAWGSAQRHPERRTLDGILVLRLDVPLFWANATEVTSQVLAAVDETPGTYALLLDLEATSQLDTTSVDALDVLLEKLTARGVELYLVRVFQRARDVLRRSGFLDRLGAERMWHSISAGVRAAREAHQVEAVPADGVAPDDLSPDYVPGEERIAARRPEDEPDDEQVELPPVPAKPRKGRKKHH